MKLEATFPNGKELIPPPVVTFPDKPPPVVITEQKQPDRTQLYGSMPRKPGSCGCGRVSGKLT